MKKQLYEKQVAHAAVLEAALLAHGAALDSSSTGTGKTLVAAEIARAYPNVFVVGLKSSLTMWHNELAERGVKPIGVINYELLRRGKTKFGKWVGHNLWEWGLPKDTLIIHDECQRYQGVASLNSRMLIAAKPYKNLLLSATAAESPVDMRALGYVLGLHNLAGFWRWCKDRGCSPNQWGGLDFNGDEKVMQALHSEIFPAHGSRLTVADLSEHFKETQIITTPIDFGDKIKEIYKQMEEELADLAEVMTSDSRHPAAERLVAQLRARQKTELLKVPTMLEMGADLLREGRSVAYFVNFDATIEAMRGRFGVEVSIIRGGQGDRAEQVKAFQDNTRRVIICNVQAGGVSLSLHDLHGGHPRTAIISPSWNAKDIVQTLGRVHRAGGATPSQQHVLFAAGTVEVTVEKAVREKIRCLEIFNDGLDKPNEVCSIVSTMEEAHAEYSPSSLELFERCPGFRKRESVKSESAERGTRIHKALETGDIQSLDFKERHVAQTCQDFIDGLIADRRPAIPDQDLREVRLSIDLGGDLSTFGTCDRLLVYGRHGVMIDYKSGYREVADAESNAQAWSYVVGAFQKYAGLDTIEFYFLVPNRDEILTHTFSRSDVPGMTLRLNTIIRKAMDSDPKYFSPQPELCEYCARQATCPALAQTHLAFATKMRPNFKLPSELTVSVDRPKDIPDLLRLAPLMEAWAKGIKEEALRLNLEEGVEIEGFNRVESTTPRGVNSVIGAYNAVRDRISLEDFLSSCSSVSIVDLEDFFAESAKRGQKGKARDELEQLLRHADVLREGAPRYYLRESKK